MKKYIEASSGLMAQIVKNSQHDGVWISSLCHAASKGLPDNELIPLSERVDLVRDIRRVYRREITVDIDTGGDIEHLAHIVKWFEEAGATALIMEDKKYPKQNSLLEEGRKDLEDVDTFCEKIRIAKKNCDIKIYARLESLIAKKSKYEAVLRARAYIEAGADGIMVHSKIKVDPSEVLEVAEEIRKISEVDLIAVPTTYTLPEAHPFNIVIEANQMTRACVSVMTKYIQSIDVELCSVEDIFNLCGK